jgi:hypothetical protein
LLHARTVDDNGRELGTFTAATRPTDTQVTDLINQAADDVADAIGSDIPVDLYENAGNVAALGTAMLVEVSYYPEQVAAGRSPFAAYQSMYKDKLARLTYNVEHEGGDVPAEEYLHPAGAFGGNPVPINWWTPL